MSEKTLIAYYSHTGNTKNVAEKIQSITGGDLFEIKTTQNYPANYNDLVNQAQIEKKNNVMPKLTESIDISAYDTIFIGSPVWWYTFSSPIRTFLSENDFTGKTIMPFCTHGGGGASETYDEIQKLCPGASVQDGFTSYEDSAKLSDVESWLKCLLAK